MVRNFVLRVVTSGWVHWLYKWLSESKCTLHNGHMGASVVPESGEGGCERKYLCLVYAFGSASYRNFNKNVRSWCDFCVT